MFPEAVILPELLTPLWSISEPVITAASGVLASPIKSDPE